MSKKKQQVRFYKGDKRPGGVKLKLEYTKKLIKRGRKALPKAEVVESPAAEVVPAVLAVP